MSFLVRYLTATMVYLGTKFKIALLLVVIGVYSVNCLNLREKGKAKNFPTSMKNDVKSFITDIYVPGKGLQSMANAIKKGMNQKYPDEDWHVIVGRDIVYSSEIDEDYRRYWLEIPFTLDFIIMAD